MKNFTRLTILASIICLFKSESVNAQLGVLDPSFNGNGKQITGIYGTARSVAFQSDGKTILAGESTVLPHSDFTVYRCKIDGTTDSTFGVDGRAVADIYTGKDDYAYSVAIQSDGKILVLGHSWSTTLSIYTIAVVRFNSDGTLDNTFGTGGIVKILEAGDEERSGSIAIQGDGKIVISGCTYNSSQWDFLTARLNSDGSLDSGFGTSGIVITDVGTGTSDEIYTLSIQSDGKIIAAGTSSYKNCLVRYNTDGSLDTSFGLGGKVVTSVGLNSLVKSIALQADGKIIATGNNSGGSYTNYTLVRYLMNGNVDSTFGTFGVVNDTIGSFDDYATSVNLQSDGKIVVSGFYDIGGYVLDAFLVRYTTSGSIDNTFGVAGKVVTTIGTGTDFVHAAKIDSNDKIVIAGNFDNQFGVARFLLTTGVGIDETINADNIIAFPNPFTTSLSISGSSAEYLSVNVYSIEGKLLNSTEKTNGTLMLSTEDWSAGVYIVELIDKHSNYARKRVVKK